MCSEMDVRRLISEEYEVAGGNNRPRLAWLATTDSRGLARCRTVIIRDLEWRNNCPAFSLVVNRNSDKVTELLQWSRGFELCWYNVQDWIQFRFRGTQVSVVAKEDLLTRQSTLDPLREIIVNEPKRESLWSKMGPGGRKQFREIALLRQKTVESEARSALREMSLPDEMCVLTLVPDTIVYLRLLPDVRAPDKLWQAEAECVNGQAVNWRWVEMRP